MQTPDSHQSKTWPSLYRPMQKPWHLIWKPCAERPFDTSRDFRTLDCGEWGRVDIWCGLAMSHACILSGMITMSTQQRAQTWRSLSILEVPLHMCTWYVQSHIKYMIYIYIHTYIHTYIHVCVDVRVYICLRIITCVYDVYGMSTYMTCICISCVHWCGFVSPSVYVCV